MKRELTSINSAFRTPFYHILDVIADEVHDKIRRVLLALSISNMHVNHYLRLLPQSFLIIGKNLRNQAQTMFTS